MIFNVITLKICNKSAKCQKVAIPSIFPYLKGFLPLSFNSKGFLNIKKLQNKAKV